MAKKYLQEKLIAGENITIAADGKTISATGGGTAQVQSDYAQTDNTKVDFIKNKPDLSVKVDRTTKDAQNATNVIDNSKGQNGVVMQTQLADTNGTIISFNTASENGADGILGQVYAKNTTGADAGKGMRLNFTKTGAFYGVGASTPIDSDHELAVKKDVSDEATARYNADQATDAKVQVLENALDHKLSLFKFEKAPGTDQPVRLPYYFSKTMDADKATITALTLQMNNTSQTTPEPFTMDVESATTTTAGLMSAADKTKLDSLTPGGGGDIELKSYELIYDTTAEKFLGATDEATYNKMKEGKVALNLTFKQSGVTLFAGTLSDYYYLVGNNSIWGHILVRGGVDTATTNNQMSVHIYNDSLGYVIEAEIQAQTDNQTIVKNTAGEFKTVIGGYMESGLVPGEIIAYELALNQWATNPKVWFVGGAESLMAVGDTITAKVLDQDTGNSWTITNATATTYNIEGEDHIGVQLSIPKAGTVEFYVLNWVIDGEETVVVYNNDSTIELHNGAIITAHKMTQGQIPHAIDGKFIGVDGTSIIYDSTDNVLKAVPEVTKKEFDMLSEEVDEKIDESQLQSAIATREAVGVCYTKTESDGKYQLILTDTYKLDPTKINWSTTQSSVLESGITSTLVGQIPSTSAQSAWSAKAEAFSVDGTTIKMDTDRKLYAVIPSGVTFKGVVATISSVTTKAVGDMYYVGTAQPYNINIWNGTEWVAAGVTTVDITTKADKDNTVLTGSGSFVSLQGSGLLSLGSTGSADFEKATSVKLPENGITALGGTLSTEDLVFTLADSTEVTVSVVKKVSA